MVRDLSGDALASPESLAAFFANNCIDAMSATGPACSNTEGAVIADMCAFHMLVVSHVLAVLRLFAHCLHAVLRVRSAVDH